MGQKKKRNKEKIQSLNKTVENIHEKNESRKDNNTGEINAGNLVNSGRTKNRTALHTKSLVLGSDSDGQAD